MSEPKKLPVSLSLDEVMQAVEDSHTGLDNPGFCFACGERQEGCEPDARGYECESCGERSVYRAEEILVMFVA